MDIVEYDYEIEPEPTYRHELEHDHAPTEPNLLEFSSHLRCRHCIRSKGVLPDGDDSNLDEIRKNLLWGNLMAGGWGVQYLFGTSFSESDLTLQDFRSRNKLFEQSWYALDFFGEIPFWEMETKNEWAGVGTANSVLATSDNSIIVFYKGENRRHVLGMVVRPTQGWTDEERTPFDGQKWK